VLQLSSDVIAIVSFCKLENIPLQRVL